MDQFSPKTIILSVYAPNDTVSKYVRQKLTELPRRNREINGDSWRCHFSRQQLMDQAGRKAVRI